MLLTPFGRHTRHPISRIAMFRPKMPRVLQATNVRIPVDVVTNGYRKDLTFASVLLSAVSLTTVS